MIKQLLSDTRKILKLYGIGAVLFFVGVGFIQWSHLMLSPSLQQEIIMLLALALAALGFVTAMISQCLLIAQRFQQLDKKSKREKSL